MTNTQQLQSTLDSILGIVQEPFWRHADFWISLLVGAIIGLISIYYAKKAFIEAGKAKDAARAASQTVKYQNVGIELRKFALGPLEVNIRFNAARDRLSDANKDLHTILSPYVKEPQFSEAIAKLWGVLSQARESLDLVKPQNPTAESEAPQAVYNAIESHFATVNELVGDLVGLFEQKTTDFGDHNATK